MLSYLFAWIKTPVGSDAPAVINAGFTTFSSILIPARNEELTILNCLASIYKQQHLIPFFEVIVVDDHSADGTCRLVESQHYSNLKVVQLPHGKTGKKQAIAEGVRIARGNLIIMTDADCEVGEDWLGQIITLYEKKKPKMIAGPVLVNRVNSLQQSMQSQEMIVLTACGGASLYWNLPLLCSSANLAFEKTAFIEAGGFEGAEKTATGDDMFLMLKINKKFPGGIRYLKCREAGVFTNPETSFRHALGQRKRWASKSLLYGPGYVTYVAALVFFMNFIIFFSAIVSVINSKFVFALLMSLSAKCIVDLMLLGSASSFFKKGMNVFVFVFASIVYPVYVSSIGMIAPFTGYTWKGRKSGLCL
jgi:cellulose synthase/poly-beta-1,6-N-acetylglucosamine synthase-like glycosyltransferase